MRPARAVFSLLTVAAAGVGVASAQFTTSRTPAPDLAPRNSDAATLAVRQDMETVRKVVTRTVIQNSRTNTSTRRRSSSTSTRNNNNDDDDATTKQPTPSPSPPPTTTDGDDSTKTSQPENETQQPPAAAGTTGLSAGAAAGITAAAVACAAILAAVAFLFWRRRQGGIRGAVVTGDYPRGMAGGSMDTGTSMGTGMEGGEGGGEEKMPPPVPVPVPPPVWGQGGVGYGDGYADGYPQEGGEYNAGVVEERDLGEAASNASRSGSGSETGGFRIPPAGTMPGELGFAYPGEYPPPPPPPPPQQQQQQLWLGGDLGEARPVSAFTAYPSPGPVLPVSPMTPYRPDSSILMAGQQPPSRVPSYYPDPGSPDLPTFLIPGGNRVRAMSFSSMSHVGGGPRVAELVGSPPPRAVPSMMVIVEGQSPKLP
ncbi:hypothetical protein C8A01DRAFT_40238 [Parachaetomium inaequale]|uniref:Uncharacterized protein n=1 Tax=Parachaetomium inaequale TaxID=2588326 RepID=A0AAN6P7V9_9PEZI|nr:hypothetical protein C8A01DRAFT_40238 [Parachaetomium inaequale]